MRKAILGAGWLVFACSPAFGQSPEAQPAFEAASVKKAAPQASSTMRPAGGPGTSDPERFTYTNVTLKALLMRAYGVKSYQISGPGWLDSERFDILAKVPPGATKEEFTAMLRRLLVDRFNLTFHHEVKGMAAYELAVGKNGPRLKESDLRSEPPERKPGAPPLVVGMPDKNGAPQVPLGLAVMVGRMTDGIMRWTGRMQSISQLADFLGGELARPVVDKTGLTGRYDFTLAFSRDGLRPLGLPGAATASLIDTPGEGGLSLLGAVQEQLGLKLESKKDPIDCIVIDDIDRVPAEN